ncbi:hypothetical protein [Comamonas testosteroni]|uniref:hypothetical protein n=1 Tax=Comamonas testosteroni TaxID=285 RepID=UPI0006A5B888|nr:hypothetical protein [Comamonas testosteroni]
MKQTETCEISQTADGSKVDELAMLVRQLVQSLRKASPGNDLADRALDYLKRHGLAGTLLRGNSAFVPEIVPAVMKPSKASEALGTSDSACRSESVPALQEALREAKYAIGSMKTEAETAAQGDEQMMLEACEQISNEGLEASLAIDAVLGTWDMHQSQEPSPLQAVQPVKCETCNDHGMIGGPSFYDPGEGGQPCPDCEEWHRNGLAAGDLMAWAAEVGGNRIAENVVEMTRDDLQRLIAERTPQTAPAAMAVPDERAAFDEFFRKRNGLHPDTDTTFRSDAAEPWRYWQARAVLAATPAAAPDMVSVKQVDANKYCQILAALGMEEEGDPVAEVQNLQALAVTSILLDVVPGSDGMGHEVYATSVEDVVDKLSDLGSRLEDYQLGIAVAPQALAGHRDVAFEAVRQKFCKLQRYSFFLDDKGNVRRTPDYCGNWVEFEAVHTLFEPAAVEAALAAQATQGGD